MQINMHKWVESIMRSGQRCALPIMTHPGIDFIGKTVFDAVTDGNIHYQAIKALQAHFPMVAATMIMDLTIEAEAFGCPVNFSKNDIPAIAQKIVSDFDSVKMLELPSLQTGRIPQYLLAAKLAAEHITSIPVFAGCIGPFSLAGRLFDLTEIMTAAFIQPETVELLLKKCTEFLDAYIKEFKKCGVNGIVMAEPAAGMLSEDMCQSFSSNYIKKIVDENQDDTFLIILHNCGNTGHVTQAMVNTGAAGLHLGNKIDMLKVLKEVPTNRLVLGNIDPVGVLKMADSQSVKQATLELLSKTARFHNFIISTGCDTPPNVPVENIKAFFDAVNKDRVK